MRSAIKQIVLRTAFVPGLSHLYRWYYRQSVRAFLFVVSSFPEVVTIFSNRSYAEDAWIPGYSDIDFVMVIGAMEAAREVIWLRAIWRKINLIRFLFPVLNTIHMMNESELQHWLIWGGIRRLEFDRWKLIYSRRAS